MKTGSAKLIVHKPTEKSEPLEEINNGKLDYKTDLKKLQIELVKMQRWVQDHNKRVIIIFEGRDGSGKGGAIKRFTEHLNPRALQIVALPKPSELEKGQWYFQRYVNRLPNPGEIIFFDRSWYNRAVVEPVNKFCSEKEYKRFMRQVPEFEHMLYEDGIKIIKLWFSVSKGIQLSRFEERKTNPLKNWKHSDVDEKAQELWEEYGKYKKKMFSQTHTAFAPWVIVKGNRKADARLESIRYVLSQVNYSDKDEIDLNLSPDPNVVFKYHRSTEKND